MKRAPLGMAALFAVVALLAMVVLAACSTDSTSSPEPSPTESLEPPKPVSLTFGAWGTDAEIAAYGEIIDEFGAARPAVTVQATTFDGPGDLDAALVDGTAPEVFLATREQIQAFASEDRLLPVDSFLDARRVNLGDDIYRSATEALSNQSRLMCMPFAVSAEVIYYNTDLVDFAEMAEAGVEVPGEDEAGWSTSQFWQAVAWARAEGVYVEETVQGIAPWLTSAGAGIFDRAVDPTSLVLSPGGMESLLDPLEGNQAEVRNPVRAFEKGRLAVLVADRSIVPTLRASAVPFDAMPMPGSAATSGTVSGICLNATAAEPETAADLMVAFNSEDAGSAIAGTGSLVPANRVAVASAAFSAKAPLNTEAFDLTAANLRPLPAGVDWDALEVAVDPFIKAMFVPGADLEALTDQANEASRAVLAPDDTADSLGG
ncbi:hypothetical protein BH09ACT11_BH09ACT11_12410 [soil metagenome]